MKRREAIAYLNREGNLRVPCSRYGWDTFSCSPVAYRLAYIIAREQGYAGTGPTEDELEWAMGLVVNDHDDVAHMIREYGNSDYR